MFMAYHEMTTGTMPMIEEVGLAPEALYLARTVYTECASSSVTWEAFVLALTLDPSKNLKAVLVVKGKVVRSKTKQEFFEFHLGAGPVDRTQIECNSTPKLIKELKKRIQNKNPN